MTWVRRREHAGGCAGGLGLGMSSQHSSDDFLTDGFVHLWHRIQVAEKLYQEGNISYPRTETDKFSDEAELRSARRYNAPTAGPMPFDMAKPRALHL